jgi:spermidine synthase
VRADGDAPGEPGPRVVVARASDERGEIALARRGDVTELIVNGAFAMDTVHTATERALATLALERLAGTGLRVLVGGLGLGFTARALLADPRVTRVEVVELHAPLVEWAREELVPPLAGLLDDPRLSVTVGDVLDVVPALPHGGFDAVLLDVDNGPGFLIHERNTAVYRGQFLAAAVRALTPGGMVVFWSADPSPDLTVGLAVVADATEAVTLDVERDGRSFTYTVYLGRRRG